MIILGKMQETGTRKTGKTIRRGANYFPETESFAEPHAVLYAVKELKNDLENAHKFAEAEGFTVHKFPKGTRVKSALAAVREELAKGGVATQVKRTRRRNPPKGQLRLLGE